jgi:radical SAM protein with 4Fe4S-binding SPASM domain
MEAKSRNEIGPKNETPTKTKPVKESELAGAKLLLSPRLVHLTDEEGWHLFFDPDYHVWVRLNESGKEIIETVQRRSNLDESIRDLALHYRLAPDNIKGKVVEFIRDMVETGIIQLNEYKVEPPPKSVPDSHPSNVYFSNTERCNLSCVYCYNAESRKDFGKFREEMSTGEQIQALSKLWNFGVSTVAFCGGEPMHRSDLFEVAQFAKYRGYRTALISNGTLITENIAPKVVELFDLIWISLDSHIKAEHEALRGRGSFDRTMRAIKMLAKLNPRQFVVNSVVCGINVRSMPETHRLLLDEIGVHQHRMGAFLPTKEVVMDKNNNPIKSVLFDNDHRKFLMDAGLKLELGGDELPPLTVDKNDGLIIKHAPRRIQCGFANGDIHMVSNGDIYPCVMMYKEEFRAGNILQEDIEKIYRESDAMKKCREATVDSIEECKGCFVKNVCAGGCRGTAYEMYGDIKAYHKDLCPLLKESAIDSLWLDTRIPFNKMEQAVDLYKQRLRELGEIADSNLPESAIIEKTIDF